jgi:hypothetical protein
MVKKTRGEVLDRIESERFILRTFEMSDAEAAFGWFGNPEPGDSQ